jgi:hypothetical protein
VFGGALGTAALLYLLLRTERLTTRRPILIAGAVLGAAVLGYSSLLVLIGLFGLVLLGLLAVDARGLTPPARNGVALALVAGGIVAGALFYIPLLAGLAAVPLALRRALPSARPILVSWLAAWALIMLLKEPFLFPKLLRWAKEDQFLSPLLCLLIGGAVGALPRAWLRWGAGAAAVAVALWLQLRDFWHHAVSLRL